MKGWQNERKRHSLARQGIRTGRKITNLHTFAKNLDDAASQKDIKDFMKLLEIAELLKDESNKGVDLKPFKLDPESPLLQAFIESQENLEVIGRSIRRVDRIEEMERFVEIKQNNIVKALDDIEGLKKQITADEIALKEAIEKLDKQKLEATK